MAEGKKGTNRNVDIEHTTWAKVGIMAATMNKPKKMVVAEAIEYYHKAVAAKFDLREK